jgi:hypothetical protein
VSLGMAEMDARQLVAVAKGEVRSGAGRSRLAAVEPPG